MTDAWYAAIYVGCLVVAIAVAKLAPAYMGIACFFAAIAVIMLFAQGQIMRFLNGRE